MRPAGVRQLLTFFFRVEGRIGRMEYLLGAGFVYAANLAVLSFTLGGPQLEPSSLAALSLIALPSLIAWLVVIAKRCHDIGLSGLFVILALMPFVGIFWVIALALVPGTAGSNRYGAAPEFGAD